MTGAIGPALRLLARFWLEEVRAGDLATIGALPDLAEAWPAAGPAALTDLAAEYQRLFGFNLPPYESVFIDPSAMLMAPATARVQALYGRAQWVPPAGSRAGAPDHLGLELLALADWLEAAGPGQAAARRLQTEHLALWVPPFVFALGRLQPAPFYARLGELTVDLLLTILPPDPLPPDAEPFPSLPPPPRYRGHGLDAPPGEDPPFEPAPLPPAEGEAVVGLRAVVERLLIPRRAGLFLSREEIARLSHALELPGVVGERARMLTTLFQQAGQYGLVPPLFDRLLQVLAAAEEAYRAWAAAFPAWTAYSRAWRARLESTRQELDALKAVALAETDLGPGMGD